MDLLNRLLQAQSARNNQNIIVQRGSIGQCQFKQRVNSNSTPFLTISSYGSAVYNAATHTQGIQPDEQLGNAIHRSTNISNKYNSNINNNSNNSGIITQSINTNNSTNSMNTFCNKNTFSQSNGAGINRVVDYHKSRDNSATNNSSCNGFQAIHKNDNCFNDGSKHGLNFDQHKYISSLCNTDANSVNNSHNKGNSTSIAIDNTNSDSNNNTNNFGTKLVQMNNARIGNQLMSFGKYFINKRFYIC